MPESLLQHVYEIHEGVRLHGTVHEKDCVIIIIQIESIPFDHFNVRKACCPALCNGCDFGIKLNSRYPAGRLDPGKICQDPSLAAAYVYERIFRAKRNLFQQHLKSPVRRRLTAGRSVTSGIRSCDKAPEIPAADLTVPQ